MRKLGRTFSVTLMAWLLYLSIFMPKAQGYTDGLHNGDFKVMALLFAFAAGLYYYLREK